MKFVSCSQCGTVKDIKKTAIIEHKRICHDCKKENSKKVFVYAK
jgi:hypothetical protein